MSQLETIYTVHYSELVEVARRYSATVNVEDAIHDAALFFLEAGIDPDLPMMLQAVRRAAHRTYQREWYRNRMTGAIPNPASWRQIEEQVFVQQAVRQTAEELRVPESLPWRYFVMQEKLSRLAQDYGVGITTVWSWLQRAKHSLVDKLWPGVKAQQRRGGVTPRITKESPRRETGGQDVMETCGHTAVLQGSDSMSTG